MLYIVTVATESKYYFSYLKMTCSRFGANLTVLGQGEKWGGYIWKFKKMVEFLKKLSSTDVVCFVDGYDVVCRKSLATLVPKFLEIKNRERCKIIIAKDYNIMLFEYLLKIYFGTCANQRLNSGTYIGFATDILDILTNIIRSQPSETDDQLAITKYCNINQREFYIDKKYELFYVSLIPMKELSVKQDTDPFFVHAAGCGFLTNVLHDLGYKNVDPRIKYELMDYFIKKEVQHVKTFFYRYFIPILIGIILLFIIFKR